MARALLHHMAHWPALGAATALVQRIDSARPRILRVLTYHRVGTPTSFAEQMRLLIGRYRFVDAAQVAAAIEGGPPLPPRSVLLTFDDGYRCFARNAWPILRAHGIPAVLFVPTAYPDSAREGFWWDRLEQAFQRTERRASLASPVGSLPMATPDERVRAHHALKSHMAELPHAQVLRTTDETCRNLGEPSPPHEVLGWDELRTLAREGLTVGAHTRTHPRLDRVPRAEARDEILGSLADLARELPDAPRVFAYPDGRHDDEIVEWLRGAGAELGFTTRRGVNDLARCDPLRLRRVHADARDDAAVLGSRLAAGAARLAPLHRLLAPPSATERREERARRRRDLGSRYFMRSLDAVLTAGLVTPVGWHRRHAATPRSASRAECVRKLTRLAVQLAPTLGPALGRALVRVERLPLRAAAVELRAFGTGVTVFRIDDAPGQGAWALKVHRSSLGRAAPELATAAERGARRVRRLREAFGDAILPGCFLVLHSPLRGAPAVACVQRWLSGELRDLISVDEAELEGLLSRHSRLAREFAQFARSVLECWAAGWYPDLLGAENLVAVREDGVLRLRLIDYGIFERGARDGSRARELAMEALVARLRARLERWREHALVPG